MVGVLDEHFESVDFFFFFSQNKIEYVFSNSLHFSALS